MFRNLLHIVRRFKVSSALNVIGLSLAFASFIVIMMQVEYEFGYNKSLKNHKQIYRIDTSFDGKDWFAVQTRPVAFLFREVPEVKSVAEMMPVFQKCSFRNTEGGKDVSFTETMIMVSYDYPAAFSFDMVEGDINGLKISGNILIPKSISDAFFPDGNSVGSILSDLKGAEYKVAGVYKDFPKNVTVKNIVYSGLDEEFNKSNFDDQSYNVFLLLNDGVSPDGLLKKVYATTDNENFYYGLSKDDYLSSLDERMKLTSLDDVYFAENVKYDFGEKGSRSNTYLLMCIAFIILIIAAINFVNFSTALAPMRIKSINTQKVLGSTNEKLRLLLISEAVLISLFGFMLSLIVVVIAKGTFIAELISPDMSFGAHKGLLIAVGGISIITGLIAGIYPSFYLTSFPPALVLKGSFGLSPRGRRLRSGLLSLQYIASIVLLSVAAFMFIQNRFMTHRNYGYSAQQVICAEFSSSMREKERLATMLKSNENVVDVAFSFSKVSCDDNVPNWGTRYKGEPIQFECVMCMDNLPRTLGVNVTEGRTFDSMDGDSEQQAYMFNERAKEMFGLNLGENFNSGKIVGFFSDIQYSSFRKSIGPMAFMTAFDSDSWMQDMFNQAYVRIAEGYPIDDAIKYVKNVLKEIDPYGAYEVLPYETHIINAYNSERNLSKMTLLFSFIAIILSVIGVFGLVVFETEYKKKEIGVRKVFGSTSGAILSQFSLKYVKMIAVCSVIAIPIAWYIVYRWLEGFTIRTRIYWWVFALAVLIIALVTLATVTYQNFIAARANPVDSLKGE